MASAAMVPRHSHRYVSMKAAEVLQRPLGELEIVSCHLGIGASLCAIDHGRSIDTTMGMTVRRPDHARSRAGSIDPAVMIHLMEQHKMSPEKTVHADQHRKRPKGISGISNDIHEIEAAGGRRPSPRPARAQGLLLPGCARTSAPASRRWAVSTCWPSPATSAKPAPRSAARPARVSATWASSSTREEPQPGRPSVRTRSFPPTIRRSPSRHHQRRRAPRRLGKPCAPSNATSCCCRQSRTSRRRSRSKSPPTTSIWRKPTSRRCSAPATN